MSRRAARCLALLLVLAPFSAAHACSCLWGGPRGALERAEVVFLGRPVAFRPSLLDPLSEEVTRFTVERV